MWRSHVLIMPVFSLGTQSKDTHNRLMTQWIRLLTLQLTNVTDSMSINAQSCLQLWADAFQGVYISCWCVSDCRSSQRAQGYCYHHLQQETLHYICMYLLTSVWQILLIFKPPYSKILKCALGELYQQLPISHIDCCPTIKFLLLYSQTPTNP